MIRGFKMDLFIEMKKEENRFYFWGKKTKTILQEFEIWLEKMGFINDEPL